MSSSSAQAPAPSSTVLPIILALSFCHMLNDLMQSLIPAIYPILKANLALSFGQIGLITLVFQGTASILQPLVGLYTDRRPQPFSLVLGMGFTLTGLLLLALAASFPAVLLSVAFIGMGSAVFHPESSRIARLAAGARPGMAQSVFQLGGNFGASLGPLAAAAIVLPRGQTSLDYFAGVALLGMGILTFVGRWFRAEGQRRAKASRAVPPLHDLPPAHVRRALFVLIALTFSKNAYTASFSSYYMFYAIDKFQVSTGQAQVMLFLFLLAGAAGTLIGGPLGDKIGRKRVIWFSILGVFPFSFLLPFAGLWATVILAACAALILASAFPAIVVYAQELMPHRTGAVAGLFFGLAFGMGALSAAALGQLADWQGIGFVYQLCAYLPLLGLLAVFLPDLSRRS